MDNKSLIVPKKSIFVRIKNFFKNIFKNRNAAIDDNENHALPNGKACRDQSRRNKQHNKNARCSTVQKLLSLAPDEAKANSNTRVSDLSRCMQASQ